MNKQEISQAIKLLGDRIDRHETIIDGDGQSLTVYWLDGSGQRMFMTLNEVEEFCRLGGEEDERLECQLDNSHSEDDE